MSHVTYSYVGQKTHVTHVTSHMKQSSHMSLCSFARFVSRASSKETRRVRVSLGAQEKVIVSLSCPHKRNSLSLSFARLERLTLTLSCAPRETHSHSLLCALRDCLRDSLSLSLARLERLTYALRETLECAAHCRLRAREAHSRKEKDRGLMSQENRVGVSAINMYV